MTLIFYHQSSNSLLFSTLEKTTYFASSYSTLTTLPKIVVIDVDVAKNVYMKQNLG